MSGQFEEKVALVTGGSSGIGRATAIAFAREGAKVVVADLDVAGGKETVRMIEETGGEAVFVQTDVSKAIDVESMVKRAVTTYGRLDCAFNNAGIGAIGPVHALAEDDWDRTLSINLKGVWLCMKYEILHMLKHGGGAIVNNASAHGLVGGPNVAYVASKHGVVGLTKSAAIQYAQQGIRANAVCPGHVSTPLLDRVIAADPGAEARMLSHHPVGRLGEPHEIAEAVLWLCSDAASFVTGHAMAVDGGWVAQ